MSRLERAKERLPKAPDRANFSTEEGYEEARGYWQSHVGRILGLAKQMDAHEAARKAKPPDD
jgi:hypothetical protein